MGGIEDVEAREKDLPNYKFKFIDEETSDPVNPNHYEGDLVARIIEHFGLGFNLGNVIKYVLRAQNKNGVEDLKKAEWYIKREIMRSDGNERIGDIH